MPQRVASAGQGLVAGIAAASALILVAATPTPTAKPQPSPTVNWNKFHLDLGNTAFNDQEKTLTKGTVKRLNLLWQFTTNGEIYESPSVSGSRVFVGDSSGTLWVLNNDTGAVLDQLALGSNAYGSGAYSTPTVEGDFIYYQDASGNLVKYDLVNRVPVWTALAPPQDAGFCSPVVYNGRVYAGLSNGSLDNPCTVGKMQAFDKMTGALLWNWDAVPPGYLGGGESGKPRPSTPFAISSSSRRVIRRTGTPAAATRYRPTRRETTPTRSSPSTRPPAAKSGPTRPSPATWRTRTSAGPGRRSSRRAGATSWPPGRRTAGSIASTAATDRSSGSGTSSACATSAAAGSSPRRATPTADCS